MGLFLDLISFLLKFLLSFTLTFLLKKKSFSSFLWRTILPLVSLFFAFMVSVGFSVLQEKFSNLFSSLSGKKKLSPEDIDKVLRSLRIAFLDADVALPVVRSFIASMEDKLKNQQKIHEDQDPQEYIMGLVYRELLTLLKGKSSSNQRDFSENLEEEEGESLLKTKEIQGEKNGQSKGLLAQLKKTLGLKEKNHPWSTVMMVGLQGNGKTTMSSKLAYLLTQEPDEDVESLKKFMKQSLKNPLMNPQDLHQGQNGRQNKKNISPENPGKKATEVVSPDTFKKKTTEVLLVSLDTYRPGAQEQLALLAKKISVESLGIVPGENPLTIAQRALDTMKKRWEAHPEKHHVMIVDTAGRLEGDEVLMKELVDLKSLLKPEEIFFVGDALLGQQGLKIAQGFHDILHLTGVCLSKTEADSRCGIVLSLRAFLGLPIKLMGTGERPQDVMAFDAERIVGRLLDQGDMIALVEKANAVMTKAEQDKALRDLQSGHFTLNHLKERLDMMEKMGGFSQLLNYMPGIGKMKKDIENKMQDINIKHQLAILSSMTPKERQEPKLLTLSRRKRIAQGSGTKVEDVQQLLKRFEEMKNVMNQLKGLF